MKKKIFLFLFSFFILLLIYNACSVEQFEPPIKLVAPYPLIAYNSNQMILLQFYGDNKENYFSGYVIYISTNANSGWTNVKNAPGDSTTITMPLVTMTAVNLFTYWIQSNIVDPVILGQGANYYFYVAAYSAQYNVYSLPSNITNIVYDTNL